MHMVSWKFWVVVGILGLSFSAASVHSPAASAPPSAPITPPPLGADAESWVKFGVANGSKGDLDGAISAFNQAIKIDPKDPAAYYNRALALSLQYKLREAIADCDKAIQLAPKYKEAFYERGTLRGREGDFDAAIRDFSRVLELDSAYASAYYNRGHAKYFKGDLEGALADINQSIALDPNPAYSYFIRGLIQHAQGDRPEADADFQKSAGLGYPYAALWAWIGKMEDGQRGVAQQDLTQALTQPQFKPNDWPTQIAGFLLEKLTQDQLVAKSAEGEANEANNQLCEAWFYAGMSRRLAGDAPGARECFLKAAATGAKGSEEFVEANRELHQG
jgi:lipoprotein NlpI